MKITFAFLLLTILSCTKVDPVVNTSNEIRKYIHISHTAMEDNSMIHPKSVNIDYTDFDITLLGGDLAHLSSHNNQSMDLINSIFDIGSESTHWSLGNHDYSNPALIESYTKRPSYYTHHENGITFVILDTQKDSCRIRDDQLIMVENVIDTISNSSHLIVLTHKLIWMPSHPILDDQITSVSNGQFGDFHYSLYENNFYMDVYPKLVSASNKGIEVICVAGDIGKHTNEFDFKTEEGIQYLASGLNYLSSDDQYLIFDHNITTGILTWEFQK